MHLGPPAVLLSTLVAAGALGACGSAGQSSSSDSLRGRSAAEIVTAAQGQMRTGHYAFVTDDSQTSTATGASGVPDGLLAAMNSHIRVRAHGIVSGSMHASAVASFDGGSGDVDLVEAGCGGYVSLDGGRTWSSSADARWVTRMVAPSFDDSMTTLGWSDLGVGQVGGMVAHHLRATLSWKALHATAVSPSSTPDPGVTVVASPIDMWVRATDALPLRVTQDFRVTMDLAAMSAGTPYAGASGTVRSEITQTTTFTPSTSTVSAPNVSAGAPPVPAALLHGFGAFGVQKDACDAGAPAT